MKFWQVDSFTDQVFKGNPAAVFVPGAPLSDKTQQKIAQEMNLSETAFVTVSNDVNSIRWFTPNAEVDLCGHATLAAAHILWEQNFIKADSIVFDSLSGALRVSRKGKNYTLDFPAQPATEKPYESEIREILGTDAVYIGSNEGGEGDCLVALASSDLVRQAKPDLEKVKNLAERGLLLTAPDESGEYDFIYRAFFPKLDVPEDPVTGSAITCLGPYWAARLGKNKLRTYQASARGGVLEIEVGPDRVLISGTAVTVFEGNFLDAALSA